MLIFRQRRTGKQSRVVRLVDFMNAEFLWRLDDFPHEGTIVWITHNNQPLRWSYLPEGATRFDVEKEFRNGYRWRKAISCRATIITDGRMIDCWRFMVQPVAEMHVG